MKALTPTVPVALLIATACATGGQGGSNNSPVTGAEILATEATYAYDVLRELRPWWLQRTVDGREGRVLTREARNSVPRPLPPNTVACRLMVYVGEEGAQGDDLRRLRAIEILEIRLIPAGAQRPDGSRCSHNRPAIHVIPR